MAKRIDSTITIFAHKRLVVPNSTNVKIGDVDNTASAWGRVYVRAGLHQWWHHFKSKRERDGFFGLWTHEKFAGEDNQLHLKQNVASNSWTWRI